MSDLAVRATAMAGQRIEGRTLGTDHILLGLGDVEPILLPVPGPVVVLCGGTVDRAR